MGAAKPPPDGHSERTESAGSGDPPAARLPVRSSLFAPSALGAWAAAAFDLPDPVRCRLVSTSVNDTYRLDAGNDTCCFLRVARHAWRTVGDLEAELRLIEELRFQEADDRKGLAEKLEAAVADVLRIAHEMRDGPTKES